MHSGKRNAGRETSYFLNDFLLVFRIFRRSMNRYAIEGLHASLDWLLFPSLLREPPGILAARAL